MTQRLRGVMDLRGLPDVVFGPRDIMWWGTLGFVLIEGFTLVLCAAAYIYVTQNFATWPPEHTPLPSLGAPTAQVVVMLASLIPALWTSRAAHRYDLGAVRIGLTIATVFALAIVGLRMWELLVSLNVKWDANVYGSVQWLVLGAHGHGVLRRFVLGSVAERVLRLATCPVMLVPHRLLRMTPFEVKAASGVES